MIEIIRNEWAIDSDDSCVTVFKRKVNQKTGEKSWTPEYYYSDFKQALAGLFNRGIQSKSSEFKTFEAMIEAIRDCEKSILDAIKDKITGKEKRFNLNVPIL